MKEAKKENKDVIIGFKANRESIYYTSLFSVAFAASILLLIFGKTQNNKGLVTYASVLIPVFLISALIAARFTCVGKNKVYLTKNTLVIKTFFITRKFKTSEIKKLTSAQYGDGCTSLNIKYHQKTYKYNFKNITKDDVSKIKHAIPKH